MKPFRGTAIFLVLVLGLAGYTFWEYKKAEMHSGDTEHEKRLFFFVPADVKSFKLTRGSETLNVVREGDDWKMIAPIEDLAEKSAVDAFLYSVMIQKGRRFREADETAAPNWKNFGLEPPGAVIEIDTGKKTETLAVSSKNAYDGSYFLRFGDELMLGDHGLAQVVGRDPATLRSKQLFRDKNVVMESAQVSVAAEGIKDSFTLIRSADGWGLEPKPAFPVDRAKIESWLTGIHGLSGSEIAAESLNEGGKREFLLLKPSLSVNVKLNSGKTWELVAGQDRGDDVFVYGSSRPTVYKTAKSALAALRVTRAYFRDGRPPFQFPVEQAHRIAVDGRVIEKDGSNWKLTDAKADEELNQDKLAFFMQSLAKLEALSYPSAVEAKGFKPGQKVTVSDSQGKVLLEIAWGDEFKPAESWNKGMTFRFVKTNLEKGILGVNAAQIASLADAKLVLKREPKTEKK